MRGAMLSSAHWHFFKRVLILWRLLSSRASLADQSTKSPMRQNLPDNTVESVFEDYMTTAKQPCRSDTIVNEHSFGSVSRLL